MYSKELEKIAEQVKQSDKEQNVIKGLKKILSDIESNANGLLKNYVNQKFERRLLTDYKGKEDKIRSIIDDIKNLKNAYFDAVKKLQSNVG